MCTGLLGLVSLAEGHFGPPVYGWLGPRGWVTNFTFRTVILREAGWTI